MPEEKTYQEIMDAADDELFAYTRGNADYLKWLCQELPFTAVIEAEQQKAIQKAAEDGFPIPYFEAIVLMNLATHKAYYQRWKFRDVLPVMASPVTPGRVN